MKNSKVFVIYFYLLITLVIFTGCWDSKELDQLAIILGTGVDKEGEKLHLTVQIVKPAELKGGSEAVYVTESNGTTVSDAVKNATNQTNRRPYFPHNEVIVIGKELAKQGIYPALDFFLRNPEPRPTEWVLIADGKAADIFQPKSEMEDTSALALKLLVNGGNESKVSAINLQDINAAMINISGAYLIPIVRVMGKNDESRLLLDGAAAVFKRDKMVGEITSSESRGVKWVKGKVKNTSVVSKLQGIKGIVSVGIFLNWGSIKAFFVDGEPQINVHIYVEGEVQDQSGSLDLTTSQGMKQVKESTEHTIKQEVISTIKKAQSFNADVFGFGRAFSQTYPEEWKEMELSWEETFQNLSVEVTVGGNLWRVGDLSRTVLQ